ncbi:16S rRNA (guanine(527)-N(7))-methyltransferase RsmG [Conexibacter sp. JD483]|uniref:16S rRNA (guanine(527)-N(7))-methyltransferase RsmG n=1 Tax=unclassified Conexibacter TaxID=2627773 RepID=UPI0027188B72|nr:MULTISPECIES: 16S rRNA (guanine(527)-N(7))-methyltransferase RsmG [unclassified Conexibacter]MDO8184439.1 16S rRNA (guanine(527)-N(7))-methyltransferase RsmG [Conexibacter sp. CPCC 205706]MDO8197745.1 16S rRNA (guanine(527)-N(7))-methyltransferase RsmG [Conexibacter sp. CPCC 205762]MDR9368119.1 16S rRNA (guanine(527)-N(7))-methyltransferase RsmG [Conexibacter sp. JD483]
MTLTQRTRARVGVLTAQYDLPAGAADQFAALLERLDDEHAPTTVRDPREAADVHLADSLAGLALPIVRAATSIADLGAGAGFPGLPLAVALGQADVRLVESIARKCAFITAMASAASIPNAVAVARRAEEWPEGIGAHDLVTARALAPLGVLAEYAAPLLREGGALVAWKGRRDEQEEADAGRAAAALGLELDEPLPVSPYEGADHRHLYVLRKVAPTPDRFPRRPGMARKRPL